MASRIKKILVVDDEPDITSFVKRALENTRDFDVDSFNSPSEVLASFRAGVYDLLILDIKMPEITGFELYRQLYAIDSRPKVCFMTAFEMYYDEFRRVFPSIEVRCFIQKPIGLKDLVKQIRAEFQQ